MGWSVERAKEYMLAHTAASEGNVDAEVKRYCTWPGQATGYKMGEMEIWRLRRRYAAALGADKFDVRAFHDLILLNGSLPLSVVEELVEEDIAARQAQGGASIAGAAASKGTAGTGRTPGTGQTAGTGPSLGDWRPFALGLVCGLALTALALSKPKA